MKVRRNDLVLFIRMELEVEDTQSLRGDICDIRKLRTLKRVHNYVLEFVPGRHYYAVMARSNIPLFNWKQIFKFTGICDESIQGECTIMDGNYTFSREYPFSEYVFYHKEEEL